MQIETQKLQPCLLTSIPIDTRIMVPIEGDNMGVTPITPNKYERKKNRGRVKVTTSITDKHMPIINT